MHYPAQVEGGELFERIVKKSRYSELEARDCVKTILQTVRKPWDARASGLLAKPLLLSTTIALCRGCQQHRHCLLL